MLHSVFDLIPIFFFLMFAVMIGVILLTVVKTARERKGNDSASLRKLEARVASKRSRVGGLFRSADGDRASACGSLARSIYYVTFQLQDGGELELQVSESDYGKLKEGERGVLSAQGTRYVDFVSVPEDVS